MSNLLFEGQSRKRREVNLGGYGVASTSSAGAILARAQADRLAREEERKRATGARKIQAIVRGRSASRDFREMVRTAIEESKWTWSSGWDANKVERIQSLHLLLDRSGGGVARDHEILIEVVRELTGQGHDGPWRLSPSRAGWSIRQRRYLCMVIRKIPDVSPKEVSTLTTFVQNVLLATESVEILRPAESQIVYSEIFSTVRQVILSAGDKTNPSLLPCVQMVTTVFRTKAVSVIGDFLTQKFGSEILTIPSLPYELPISALQALALGMPHRQVVVAGPQIAVALEGSASRTAYLANLISFELVRLSTMDAEALGCMLRTLSTLINAVPAVVFKDARSTESGPKMGLVELKRPDAPAWQASIPRQPDKVVKALANLFTSSTLESVLTASRKHLGHAKFGIQDLCAFLHSLLEVTSAEDVRHETVLHTCLYATKVGMLSGATLFREVWRSSIRSGLLMRAAGGASGKLLAFSTSAVSIDELVKDDRFADDWLALLLIVELYSRLLLTMGDDEFFASIDRSRLTGHANKERGAATSNRNPFSIDEVLELTGLIRNLGFAMYWDELRLSKVDLKDVTFPLESGRTALNKLVGLIHDRDSRRSFTPPGFWEMVGVDEVPRFVAAVLQDEAELLDRVLSPEQDDDGTMMEALGEMGEEMAIYE